MAAYRSPPLQIRAQIFLPEGALCWHILQAMLRSDLHPAYRFLQAPSLAAVPCLSIISFARQRA